MTSGPDLRTPPSSDPPAAGPGHGPAAHDPSPAGPTTTAGLTASAGPTTPTAPAANGVAQPAPPRPAGRRSGPLAGFAPFTLSGFRFLFLGTTLTMAGYFMQMVAQGWLIYDLTGSSTWLGIVSFANGIPMLVLALPAGVLVDRVDRRFVLSVAQVGTALVSFLLAGMIWIQAIEAWHVAVLSFVSGCFFVAIVPARQALLPGLVERSMLSPAIAMMSAGTNFGRVIGPALGGLTIATLGAALAFGLQGVGFVLALLCAVLLPRPRVASRPRSRSAFGSLLEGLRYVWQNGTVFNLMLLQAIPAFILMPYTNLMPIFARDILHAGPDGLGTLMMAMGIGALAGSMLIVFLPARRQGLILLVALSGLSVGLIGLAASESLLLSIGIMGLIGLTQSVYLATNNTLVQLAVPDALQGRVMSVYMTTWGLLPLGALPQGILADHVGAPAVVAGAGLLSLLVIGVMAARNPSLRTL
ncbi:MAG: MFS transporter [Chloroflexi bacterium]|nr:MFS transporter [Chloroflexota bacterium]